MDETNAAGMFEQTVNDRSRRLVRRGLPGRAQDLTPGAHARPPADLNRRQLLRQEVGHRRPMNPADSPVDPISTANRPNSCDLRPLPRTWIPPRVR
ncbi:hypothetical protein [Streptomyces sp. NPDC086787]|uniref:hypothetical protein n=1 Tax=Streptomyces sp. NPDC086787 TaxID=3365759 RepID=UPI0038106D6A